VPLTAPSDVEVRVYTLSFRLVNELRVENLPPGQEVEVPLENRWGTPLANGLYYLVVQAAGKSWVVKLLIVR